MMVPAENDFRERTEDVPDVFGEETDDGRICVLVVDDEPAMLDLTRTFLERERDRFDVVPETSVEAALEHLESGGIDAIVSDYDMPAMNGLEFLQQIRERNADVPFILFTGKGSEEIASEAISKGVTDYLRKKTGASQYSILANRLINAVEKHRASKALKRSQEKFSKLVMNSSDMIAIVDENCVFQYISPAVEHILGYDQEELIDQCAFDYMAPEDRQEVMEEFFTAVENPEYEPIIETRWENADGGWTVLEVRGKNLFDDDRIQGFVANGRDVTPMKEREQELTQQNERLKDMRKLINYDLREPLDAASDSLELFRETDEEAYLDGAERSIDRTKSLLDQVITLADQNTEIESTEQVPLKETVRAAWEVLDTEGATLQVDDSKEFEADPRRLQQLFENLLRNAVEHTAGDVTIRVGTTEGGFYVEDDGPGIPEADREHVFESGFTTDDDKTGFGLNIVKQIVLGHGWEISVTESAEGGARFEITGVTFQPTVYN